MKFFESTYIYFPEGLLPFDRDLLKIIIVQNSGFEVFYAYSYDGINYSDYKNYEDTSSFKTDENLHVFFCIFLKRKIYKDLITPKNLNDNLPNVNPEFSFIEISHIEYDGTIINPNRFKYKTQFDITNEFPKWNIYDNHQISINEWLKQCNAIAESYGHTVIYFKTEPDFKSTIHTFSTNVVRNVVEIKKLHILIPNNELPQDRIIYSDWDLPLQDDFLIHIVWDKFKQAFGYKTVPIDKDYLFFPMINKMFQVSAVQPKNSYMGKIGWWEVYLKKYEEDENVRISENLKKGFSEDIQKALDFGNIETVPDTLIYPARTFSQGEKIQEMLSELETDMNDFINDNINIKENDTTDVEDEKKQETEKIDKLQNYLKPEDVESENKELPILIEREIFLNDTLLTQEKIDKKTIEEKKSATQNFTNKLMDTNFSVSLKETEKLREFYDKRLTLVSINPDKNAYPVVMYDCTSIEKHVIGLKYNLEDFTEKNRFQTIIRDNFSCLFNYVLRENFSSEIIDLCTKDETVILSLKQERSKISIHTYGQFQETFKFDCALDLNEYYQIWIGYSRLRLENKKFGSQFYVKIYKLVNKEKEFVYQNIYNTHSNFTKLDLSRLNLFGGKFYINEICLKINNNQILMDYCNPILQMNQFGG